MENTNNSDTIYCTDCDDYLLDTSDPMDYDSYICQRCKSPNIQFVYPGEKTVLYVNAYAVHQHYGGPAEGGWYYNSGEPIASVPAIAVAKHDPDTDLLSHFLENPALVDDVHASVKKLFDSKIMIKIERGIAEPWRDSSTYE